MKWLDRMLGGAEFAIQRKRFGILKSIAERGDAQAQCELAIGYHNGYGVDQNYPEAVKWYRKSAEQGYAMAQYALGYTYFSGEGIALDYSEAVRWYRKSSEQGYAKAQYALGYMYYYGYGVPRDRAGANDLFQKAAAQDDEDGKRALECLRKGISIDPGAGLSGLQ